MIGACIIDGTDIFTAYGMIVANNGYDQLPAMPALVTPDSNDWAEEHGLEIDLDAPTLMPHELSITFAGDQPESFLAMLMAPGRRAVSIPPVGWSAELRPVSVAAFDVYGSYAVLTVNFAIDSPDIPTDYPAANASDLLTSAVSLDGKSLDKYGIIISSGLDELARPPKIKENLSRRMLPVQGQMYDAARAKFAGKDVAFKCVLIAGSKAAFWNLHAALFGDLLKPDLRSIAYKGITYLGYYKSSGNWRVLSLSPEVIYEFTLTLHISHTL